MVLEIEDLSAGYLVSDNYTFTFWVRTSTQLLTHRINSFDQFVCTGAVLKSGFEYDSHVQSGELMDEYRDGTDKEGLLCSSSENNVSFDMDVVKIPQALIKKDQFSVAEKIALSK
ncbi:hypothetical protein AAG906_008174 [Vitis piasezkii]